MNILLTGVSSGIGEGLYDLLSLDHNVFGITRSDLDLSDMSKVASYKFPIIDMLINCAGTGIGGKIEFKKHDNDDIINIMNVNVLSPLILTRKALSSNSKCKIVNITSTNNNRYYPNDLVYSLSKKTLGEFGSMLKIEYPTINLLEIRLGLTKTNFNNNRYGDKHSSRYNDIYNNEHLTVQEVTKCISDVLFNDNIKFIEISP